VDGHETKIVEFMSTPTREEFESRLEVIEARMDARVASIEGQIKAFMGRADERERRLEERDKRQEERVRQHDKRMEQHDKRMEQLTRQIEHAVQRTSSLKSNIWLAALTVIIATVGTVMGAYHATQAANISITQTAISAFQQGQQTPASAN
jgi:ABC-type Fe3+-citrate transport system substrate-binding protein